MHSTYIRRLALLLAPIAFAACGGGGDKTGTITVATITVTPVNPSIAVGSATFLNATARNSSGGIMSGITFVWSTSDATLATVSQSGQVTAIAAGGPVTITATAQGKSGNTGVTVTDIPVIAVDVTPAAPSVGVAGAVVLTAIPRDAGGHPLTRTITWMVSDPAKLSLSATTGAHVTATGVALGNGVIVTATASGTAGTATFNVVAGTSPTVSTVLPNPMLPGASATITGTNFDATPANNSVTIDGLAATVTAATTTQLTVTLPASGFACGSVHDVAVNVITNALSGSRLAPLDPTTVVALAVGESRFFDNAASDAGCLKLPTQAGSSYLISVTNTSSASGALGPFALGGATAALVFPDHALPMETPAPASPAWTSQLNVRTSSGPDWRSGGEFHRALLDRDRRIVAARGGPRKARTAALRRPRSFATFDPHVGDIISVKIDDVDNDLDCTVGFTRQARVVYVNTNTVVLDDQANPLYGQLDAEMQSMGAEFESTTLPVERTYFGDPLAYDAELGQKGHVLIFFTSKVNSFAGGNIAGFVNSCDFFPYDVTPGPTIDTVTNEAPIFYAYVPTTNAQVDFWHSFVRSVLPHESKHLASYAAKLHLGAISWEDSWLEEATAQTASEIWGRNFSGATWKGHNPFATTLGCEYPTNPCGGDHPTVMRHHFGYLFDYLSDFTLVSPTIDAAEVYYGGAWSFVRWAVDQYGDEATILQGITQTTTVFGVDNLVLRTGAPFAEMVSRWEMASALAQYNVVPADPKLTFPSWDQGGIYRGLNQNEPAIWTSPYPLAVPTVSFGAFQVGATVVGGGARAYRLTGAQTMDEVIAFQQSLGIPFSGSASPMRLGIVRVQ